MKFVLGTKDGMTQVFDEHGVAHPATVLRVSGHTVTQVKDTEKDGYTAAQVATGEQKENRISKALRGHLGGAYATVKEFRPRYRGETIDGAEKGQTYDVSVFEPGEKVMVSATSKGRGFQGVVKRHGFSGAASKTHGTKHNVRAPGSIGATGPSRVFKGTKMAGRMGGERITVKNLKVLQVNSDENLLLISGAVPGRKGTVVEVRGIVKDS